jgi:LmbE family N-acetylglucosaminyl deacetylase
MSFRSALRPAKRALARAAERLWGAGFSACAHLVRADTARWTSAGGQKILIVAPHPDDEAIGCVGTLLLHIASGDHVCVAIATDGRQSTAIADPIQMSVQRRREAGDAAQLMRVERMEWMGFPEGDWNISALRDSLKTLIGEVKPDIVYAPSRIDFHPEHFKVAHALALALAELPTLTPHYPRVRIYQVQVPLTSLMSNLVADISALIPQCDAVLCAYVSQAASMQCAYRQRRYSARRHRLAEQAEEFWELSAGQYVDLHRTSPRDWPRAFRGLRNFAFTDPLAYLVGARQRRLLAAR